MSYHGALCATKMCAVGSMPGSVAKLPAGWNTNGPSGSFGTVLPHWPQKWRVSLCDDVQPFTRSTPATRYPCAGVIEKVAKGVPCCLRQRPQ
jgi:hypothetical protein